QQEVLGEPRREADLDRPQGDSARAELFIPPRFWSRGGRRRVLVAEHLVGLHDLLDEVGLAREVADQALAERRPRLLHPLSRVLLGDPELATDLLIGELPE